MPRRRSSLASLPQLVFLAVIAVVLAGCAGVPSSDTATPASPTTDTLPTESATEPATGTATSATPATSTEASSLPANDTAAELALRAEEKRVARILRNATGIRGNGSVGVYGDVSTSVADWTGDSIEVEVVTSYSYGYTCDDHGSVDALTTRTTYVVTGDGASLDAVHENVSIYCEGLTDLAPSGR